jgi:hypothetical protein
LDITCGTAQTGTQVRKVSPFSTPRHRLLCVLGRLVGSGTSEAKRYERNAVDGDPRGRRTEGGKCEEPDQMPCFTSLSRVNTHGQSLNMSI